MRLKNAQVYDEDFRLVPSDIVLDGDQIAALEPWNDTETGIDLQGYTIMPGFIDIHIHGYGGGDAGEGTQAALETMSHRLAQHGVTSFCPTSLTLPFAVLERNFRCVDSCRETLSGARPVGINMEGPYISPARVGGQNPAFVRRPSVEEFRQLQQSCHGLIRVVDIAPEEDEDGQFVRAIAPETVVSLAHTDASYEQACAAFQAGCRHVTHLYNAMTGFSHRSPGVVGAAFDMADRYGLYAELICDGKHIHPAALRLAFRLLGEDHPVIISDALSAAGTGDGDMVSGGLPVTVRDGVAYLKDGTIAGSTTNLEEELRNVLSYGISERQAVKAMTINAARSIGLENEIGSIAKGKRADLTIVDEQRRVVMTIVGGKIVYQRGEG